jgi:hypothetical protein
MESRTKRPLGAPAPEGVKPIGGGKKIKLMVFTPPSIVNLFRRNQNLFEPRPGGVVSLERQTLTVFLVGTVADPTRHSVCKVTARWATPSNCPKAVSPSTLLRTVRLSNGLSNSAPASTGDGR